MVRNKPPQPPEVLQAQRTIRTSRVYVALWVFAVLVVITAPVVAGIVFESWGVFICAIWVMIFPAACLGVAGVDEIPTYMRRIEKFHKIIDDHQWKEYQREQQKLQQILEEEGLS
ncbi:hypothetical protein D9B38_05590 [Corynebacterium diphtheriae]|uniref:hypothetical protein n=1 Tax=Corynebacterium diphtheriae TaxID=1717 RepID=UPI000961F13F|nr:hypothetical protein [Corynebacterium diphtheriae]MBG9337363.1 hypothetical protein [Corynebacterium diphtheriae bv. mitis]OLN17514.1 hypothetical protein BUE68_07705 [Corynebacterium diphtheriae]RKW82917.1 hypothetical protein D9B34_02790 [Corynebacterium diphtheriae]RKW91587.1 hypothetical protein D9B38_05590 [Corynebacterium diphtheriae]RKX05744.1 hypothetical protein D9C01_02770 [Corynebacterium diphtheriae]